MLHSQRMKTEKILLDISFNYPSGDGFHRSQPRVQWRLKPSQGSEQEKPSTPLIWRCALRAEKVTTKSGKAANSTRRTGGVRIPLVPDSKLLESKGERQPDHESKQASWGCVRWVEGQGASQCNSQNGLCQSGSPAQRTTGGRGGGLP